MLHVLEELDQLSPLGSLGLAGQSLLGLPQFGDLFVVGIEVGIVLVAHGGVGGGALRVRIPRGTAQVPRC